MPLLELRQISVGYSSMPVLRNVDLSLNQGEIVTLVGANGAGKSTIAKLISGLLRPMSGELLLNGKPLVRLSSTERLRLGIAHVPEGRQIFAGMTVAENLRLGAYSVPHKASPDFETRLASVCRLFPVIEKRLGNVAGNFSGGQQQMLAIARGLMSSPRLLILDEPSLGVAPLLVAEIFTLIRRLRDEGITILLAEQNARQALAIADRGYVLENGTIAMSGPANELAHRPDIAHRYLGVGAEVSVDDLADGRREQMAARLKSIIA